jgi:hypothetical protein
MKPIHGALALLLCLGGNAQAAAIQACDLNVDVIDTDPKGTNVRETPGGKIVGVLKLSSRPPSLEDWIEVHIVGQSGDWFLIDKATQVGDDETTIFTGQGYVHLSVLGAYGLWNGMPIWTDHDEKSQVVTSHAPGDEEVKFLGCWGEFAKIRAKQGTGWTKTLCLNGRTTCA